MKRSIILHTVVLLLLVTGAQSCNKIRKDKGVIASEPDLGACFSPPEEGNPNREFVIRTQTEFDSLLALTACTSAAETIDFNTYTLLGKYTTGKCKAKFFRQVVRSDSEKMLHYSILVKSHGFCDKLAFSYNWVLVPKFPADYTVHFNVETK